MRYVRGFLGRVTETLNPRRQTNRSLALQWAQIALTSPQAIGITYNLLSASVVASQFHYGGVFVTVGKGLQERTACSGERINGLVGVAHDANIVAVAQPSIQKRMLKRRDVLVLIHREKAVLLVHVSQRPRLGAQQTQAKNQHVFEVDLVRGGLGVFVSVQQFQQLGQAQVGRQFAPGVGILLHGEHGVFAPLNLRGQIANRGSIQAVFSVFCQLAQQLGLGGQNAGDFSPGELRPKVFQLRKRGSVKRFGRHSANAQSPKPGSQLGSSLVGVGQRHDSVGAVITLGDSVGDSVRNGSRLTRASSGNDAGWADQALRGGLLFRVEFGKQAIQGHRCCHQTSDQSMRGRCSICPAATGCCALLRFPRG